MENQIPNQPDNSEEPHQSKTGSTSTESPIKPDQVRPVKFKHRHVRTYVLAAIVVLVLIGVGCYAFLYFRKPAQKNSTSQTAKSSDSSFSTEASSAHLPATESATIGGMSAKYITLPLTRAEVDVDGVNGPWEKVTTASGHYLIQDSKGYTYNDTNNTGGNLLYDGKSVYDGPYLSDFVLSANGGHYLYVLNKTKVESSGNEEVYVDGKLVQTVSGGQRVFHPFVSNDGGYAYVTSPDNASAAAKLIKNGALLYTSPRGIWVLRFNDNLASFILATANADLNDHYDVVYNGQTVATKLQFPGASLPTVGISPNGRHYTYTDSKTLYVDGVSTLHQSYNAYTSGIEVSNNGTLSVVDPLSHKVTIGGKSYELSDGFAANCSPGCGDFGLFSVSDDERHYIFGLKVGAQTTKPLWSVDGHEVTLTGDVQAVEFVGNTLYMYRLTE